MDISSIVGSFNPANAQNLYVQFLNHFPVAYQPFISIVVGLLLIYCVYRIVKRDFIFIIALIIFIPASIPVLKSVWAALLAVLKYLFHYK